MFSWRVSLWLFTSNCYREQWKFMQIEAKKKTFLSCVSEQSYISFFSKFSKRTNLERIFFTFANQRRLLELLSYGEYNQLFISVVGFWKQLIYLIIFFMYSCRIKSTHTFFCCWKILITATEFYKFWIIHIWRNISQAILALRLIVKEHKIGKLHEASVQRFCQRSSQSSYLFFGKFETLHFKK